MRALKRILAVLEGTARDSRKRTLARTNAWPMSITPSGAIRPRCHHPGGVPRRPVAVTHPEAGRDPGPQVGVDTRPVGDDALLDRLGDAVARVAHDVGHRVLAVGGAHDVAVAFRLPEVIVVRAPKHETAATACPTQKVMGSNPISRFFAGLGPSDGLPETATTPMRGRATGTNC